MHIMNQSAGHGRTKQSSSGTWLVSAALAIGSLCVFSKFREWAFDDAFIVFRYAQNILLGRGWVFNPDEVYNASTSVLNTLLVTGMAAITGRPLVSSVIIGTLSLGAVGFLVFDLLRKETNVWLAGFFALGSIWLIARWEIFGVETLPFIALIMIFLALDDKKKETGWVLGLIFLTRPDGLLLAALKWAHELYVDRRLPIRSVAWFLAITAPWFIFSYAEFGQLLPSTLEEKMWQGASGYWGEGNVYWRDLRASTTRAFGWGTWGAVVLAPFCVWGVYEIFRRRSILIYFLLFVVGQQLFYLVLNVPGYHWYFAPLHTMALISIFFGLICAFDALKRRHPAIRAYENGISMALLALCLSAMLLTHLRYLEQPETNGRLEAYAQIAAFVKERFPGKKLAALEVGTFAFLTDSPMVDITGLTSAEPEFISPRNMDRFFELAPDILILHRRPHGMEASIRNDARFAKSYARLREQPRRGYALFARRGS
jgi:arabinofuranosyltransferase